MKAVLTLESGSCRELPGGTATYEVVFDTSMIGVTELITDPAYMGQALVLTCPLIGNSGVCYEDFQSKRPQIGALIVSEISEIESNFRSEASLKAVLERYNIPVITGVDTRSLVRLLRGGGGSVTLHPMSVSVGNNEQVNCSLSSGTAEDVRYRTERTTYPAKGAECAVLCVADTGMRRDLAEEFTSRGIRLEVFPYGDLALTDEPCDGFLLPGGPGDPASYDLETVNAVLKTGKPALGVGLGHNLLALANGAKTMRLNPGHRGANIPVRNRKTGRVTITSQNHGHAVQWDGIDDSIVSHENVNDGTVEGLRWSDTVFSVQFLPDDAVTREFASLLKGKEHA